ncbi:glutamate-1-semialdehyde 2,1-aminomutase [Flavobacteriaceae bacterium]|nr:glutamate-1-semialdehyde 2,1-aminomutase [Flavobacteriaceae bacterium]MDC1492264.1 glutamate-1-semialdehyde 2,1-aminomutase [Flavobacteriaceae bacterium]
MIYQRSSALFKDALKYIPGGVNSPVRAFKAVGGTPIFIKEANGAYLIDEDDNKYIEYINSWGPMILGHSYQPVVDAIIKKAKKGTSFGAPTEIENKIAKLVVKMVPNIEQIRFVNSGTEACMSAIRLSRGYTKKEKIIKFSGCYHGHSDSFLIQAGSGSVTYGEPNSPGVTKGTAKDTLIAKYNNLQSVENIISSNEKEISCIILEPIAGNMGCIPPSKGFLEGLRLLCDKYNILLIFDEVMTGFRVAKGGAQELYGIKADIVCFGKIIGGGLPVGAFASSNEIMSYLSPNGPVYQAGTLSGNPLAMAAGFSMLNAINNDLNLYDRLNEKANYLDVGISKVLKRKGVKFFTNRVGSMFSIHFSTDNVIDFDSARKADNSIFPIFFHEMLKNGIYIAPSSYESWFLSDALTYQDLDKTIAVVEKISIKLL